MLEIGYSVSISLLQASKHQPFTATPNSGQHYSTARVVCKSRQRLLSLLDGVLAINSLTQEASL